MATKRSFTYKGIGAFESIKFEVCIYCWSTYLVEQREFSHRHLRKVPVTDEKPVIKKEINM